ncbi:hypothetical protein EDE04_7366 [Streptomyces sp. 2132.2]|uniref:Uncharacterized protein n=1 Tax=Streptomyces vinaceus TaxID=1960 RepID=A0A5J6JPI9_STRVI|nr:MULTISPECIES: hypothetical protein [Streptomyces]QEV49408.1 hypothetical protein CP980_34000 [Streptomyces vinaceus]ROQ88973.1 hypothetical protein EDE04_7366 [Streptomyces sp. 2132.2]GHE45214.1 hypothetical protein GCM10017778_30990 [Streptomyces vinaceus]
MTKKWLARLAAVLAVPTMVIGISSPASATDQYVTLTTNGKLVASLHFYDDGDDWGLFDLEADGHGVRAYIQVAATDKWYDWDGGTWYNGKGAGTGVMKTDGNLLTINRYRAQVCTVDGSGDKTPVACSAWMYVQE